MCRLVTTPLLLHVVHVGVCEIHFFYHNGYFACFSHSDAWLNTVQFVLGVQVNVKNKLNELPLHTAINNRARIEVQFLLLWLMHTFLRFLYYYINECTL